MLLPKGQVQRPGTGEVDSCFYWWDSFCAKPAFHSRRDFAVAKGLRHLRLRSPLEIPAWFMSYSSVNPGVGTLRMPTFSFGCWEKSQRLARWRLYFPKLVTPSPSMGSSWERLCRILSAEIWQRGIPVYGITCHQVTWNHLVSVTVRPRAGHRNCFLQKRGHSACLLRADLGTVLVPPLPPDWALSTSSSKTGRVRLLQDLLQIDQCQCSQQQRLFSSLLSCSSLVVLTGQREHEDLKGESAPSHFIY